MSDRPYTDADIELAARAISLYDWDHQVSNNPEIGEHQRNEARAVLSALAAIGRLAHPESRVQYAATLNGSTFFPEDGLNIADIRRPGDTLLRRVVGPWLPAPTNTEKAP